MIKRRFLCTNHIHWLKNNVTEILPAWNNATEQGIYFQDRKMWLEAVVPLGCAYELSEIRLELCLIQTNDLEFGATSLKKTLEQVLMMFSASTKRFIFALMQAEKTALMSNTIGQTSIFLERLKKKDILRHSRHISELQKTLTTVQFSNTVFFPEIKTRFASPSSSHTPLTVQ